MRTLRDAVRTLLRSPGFTCIAILSLAIGIGANTAIFSLWNAVALRPLATVRPDRLVGLASVNARGRRAGFSYSTFEKIRAHQRAMADLFAWQDNSVFTLEAEGSLFPGTALLASEGFAATIPIRPVMGRNLAPSDAAVAVLGYDCWQRRFQGSPAALGKLIRIQGKPFTVVGVAPERFTDMEGAGAIDAIVPLAAFTSLDRQREQNAPGWEVTGRLRPGVALERARAELEALWVEVRPDPTERLMVESAETGTGFNFARERFTYPLQLLQALVAVLLLLASVNLSTLLLARAESRLRETCIRMALGAGRSRIFGGYLAESGLLTLAGSIAGAIGARPAGTYLAQFVWTGNIDRAHDYSVDGRVLAFTIAAAILSGLVFGLIPAWRALRTDPSVALQRASRATSASGRMAKLLVVFQVGLSVVLVLASALFNQTMRNLKSVPLGFNPGNLVEMMLTNLPGGYSGLDPETYYPELFRRLSSVPGVLSVSAGNLQPVLPPFFPDQPVSAAGATVDVQSFRVGPDYFRTLEVPLLAGRELTLQDRGDRPRVAVISESLARRLFPGESALGRRLSSSGKDLFAAGVIRDSEIGSLQKHNAFQLFTSIFQDDTARWPIVMIRTAATPDSPLLRRLRQEVVSMGREYPLRMETVQTGIDRALVKERMLAALATALGVAGLLLAIVGLYGLISYSVTRRSPEIAVRMAIGARREGIVWMIVRESLTLLAGGFALSAPAIYAGSKVVSSLLFGFTSGLWMASLLSVAAVFTVVAIASAALPAWRAGSRDPLDSLKLI